MPKLSLAKLERHLYSAADRLRQEGLDAATYKDYIFGMLFLKRCSDVFEAEREKIVGRKVEQGMGLNDAETNYGENPDYYDTFFVPERARWKYLQDKLNDATVVYGSVLDTALGALRKPTNPLNMCWTTSASSAPRATNASCPTMPAKISFVISAATGCATKTSNSPTCSGPPTNS